MEARNESNQAATHGNVEGQLKGGRWLWLEQWASEAYGNVPLDYAKKLVSKGCTKKHCPKQFDERDVKRFSRTRIQVYFMKPNITGEDRPRLVERD